MGAQPENTEVRGPPLPRAPGSQARAGGNAKPRKREKDVSPAPFSEATEQEQWSRNPPRRADTHVKRLTGESQTLVVRPSPGRFGSYIPRFWRATAGACGSPPPSGAVFSSRRAAAGGGDPGGPAESTSTTRSTKTLQGGVARPEILTKKFWPSGPRSNYFLLPPSCAGSERGRVSLAAWGPHRGPSWGPRPGWGRGRPARRPRGLHPRLRTAGHRRLEQSPRGWGCSSRGRAFSPHPPNTRTPAPRGPPSAHGGRPRRQGPGLLGRDEGQGPSRRGAVRRSLRPPPPQGRPSRAGPDPSSRGGPGPRLPP